HLHCFRCSNTPYCLQCGNTHLETIHHLFYECLRYERDHLILERALGRDTHSLLYILMRESACKYLLHYIDAMKHFQATFGEVS
ncbi:hypothetical protein SCLCIDRAFT_134357, partial [Scleroderma citrinum Foug A]